jgi:hypothetical protein
MIIDTYLPFPILFKITYIPAVNSRLGIMHCFVIFSQIMTGLMCMVPLLSILLSTASMLLFNMP